MRRFVIKSLVLATATQGLALNPASATQILRSTSEIEIRKPAPCPIDDVIENQVIIATCGRAKGPLGFDSKVETFQDPITGNVYRRWYLENGKRAFTEVYEPPTHLQTPVTEIEVPRPEGRIMQLDADEEPVSDKKAGQVLSVANAVMTVAGIVTVTVGGGLLIRRSRVQAARLREEKLREHERQQEAFYRKFTRPTVEIANPPKALNRAPKTIKLSQDNPRGAGKPGQEVRANGHVESRKLRPKEKVLKSQNGVRYVIREDESNHSLQYWIVYSRLDGGIYYEYQNRGAAFEDTVPVLTEDGGRVVNRIDESPDRTPYRIDGPIQQPLSDTMTITQDLGGTELRKSGEEDIATSRFQPHVERDSGPTHTPRQTETATPPDNDVRRNDDVGGRNDDWNTNTGGGSYPTE